MVMVNMIVLFSVDANYVLYTPVTIHVHPAPKLRMGRSLPLLFLCGFAVWTVANANLCFCRATSQKETLSLA